MWIISDVVSFSAESFTRYFTVTSPVQAPAPGRLVGSGVERTDPLLFLAGCCKRRLNQALSILRLSLVFWVLCLGPLFVWVSLRPTLIIRQRTWKPDQIDSKVAHSLSHGFFVNLRMMVLINWLTKKRSETTQTLRVGCSKANSQTNKQINKHTNKHTDRGD